MSDWKPVKETEFYDPKAGEKDAEVTISASELNALNVRLANQEEFIDNLQRENERLKKRMGAWAEKLTAAEAEVLDLRDRLQTSEQLLRDNTVRVEYDDDEMERIQSERDAALAQAKRLRKSIRLTRATDEQAEVCDEFDAWLKENE